jgi:hypothetical protein
MPLLAPWSGSLQRAIRRLPLLVALTLLPGVTAEAKKVEAAAPAGPAVFTDSSAAGLAATKRVAITNVMVSFQASVGDKTSTNGLLAHKSDTSSLIQMPDMDPQLLAAITDEIYAQLQADLKASGFEVLPEATVVSSPAYQKIIQLAGIANFSKFLNRDGDTMLVGASGLKPYLPYNSETGSFSSPANNGVRIKGWVSSMGMASSTPGGPSLTSIGTIYQLPGLEVDLAKALNAHVVKATYLVTLGSTTASIGGRFTHFNEHTGTAFAQVGIKADQSRIAFRTPNGNHKWQSIARVKVAPAKDGDVVVTLAQPLAGGTDFFTVTGAEKGKGMFGLGGGADKQFAFTVTIANPAAYRTEVTGLIKLAQKDLLALVKQ